MIWILIATYALAGWTIGRMSWEFDAFAEAIPADQYTRRLDRGMCIFTGIVWPFVPAWGLWTFLRGRPVRFARSRKK